VAECVFELLRSSRSLSVCGGLFASLRVLALIRILTDRTYIEPNWPVDFSTGLGTVTFRFGGSTHDAWPSRRMSWVARSAPKWNSHVMRRAADATVEEKSSLVNRRDADLAGG